MRVGLLTSFRAHEIGFAEVTLPLMKRYCAMRGYSLVVGRGLSAECMFEQFGAQFETSMLFLPIRFVILRPSVEFHHFGKEQMGVAGLGCTATDPRYARALAREFPC